RAALVERLAEAGAAAQRTGAPAGREELLGLRVGRHPAAAGVQEPTVDAVRARALGIAVDAQGERLSEVGHVVIAAREVAEIRIRNVRERGGARGTGDRRCDQNTE